MQTISPQALILYNNVRFPCCAQLSAEFSSFKDEKILIIEILRGSPALSAFRITKLCYPAARTLNTRSIISTLNTSTSLM